MEGKKQQVRNTVLDVIHRFPQNEMLRQFVTYMLAIAMDVLDKDNEDNALICLSIIFDLHKTYRPAPDKVQLQPFFAFVRDIYQLLPTTVANVFGPVMPPEADPNQPSNNGAPSLQQQQQQIELLIRQQQKQQGSLPRSVESFRVLTECPLIVMLLFQLFRNYMPQNIPTLLPLMVNAVKLRPAITAALVRSRKVSSR